MNSKKILPICFISTLIFGCGKTADPPDNMPSGEEQEQEQESEIDSAEALEPETVPSWRLEDIQTSSPRFGDTYGLDAFKGEIVVATLLQGF